MGVEGRVTAQARASLASCGGESRGGSEGGGRGVNAIEGTGCGVKERRRLCARRDGASG
jgi:hypothetical protein